MTTFKRIDLSRVREVFTSQGLKPVFRDNTDGKNGMCLFRAYAHLLGEDNIYLSGFSHKYVTAASMGWDGIPFKNGYPSLELESRVAYADGCAARELCKDLA